MLSGKLSRTIGVYKKALTPSASNLISDRHSKLPVDMFHINEVIINITKHVLVPRHEVMSTEDKMAVLAK
jgi:DNA-directed RNA polymerase I, II, and III subunit RPABC1